MSIPFFTPTSGQAMAEALLHSVWQGAVVAVILFLVLRKMPASRVNGRYALCLASLGLVVLAWFFTWHWLQMPPRSQPSILRATAGVEDASLVQMYDLFTASSIPRRKWFQWPTVIFSQWSSGWRLAVVCCWVVGVALMLARLLFQFTSLSRIQKYSQTIQSPPILELFDRLRSQLGIRRKVRLANSSEVDVPAVFGIFWPTVLLPVSMLTSTPLPHLQAVLAHELIHIRRHDFLIQVVQSFMESLFFFNPFTWWISRQIRVEREAACDAAAAEMCGGRLKYVSAITHWITESQQPSIAPAASGPGISWIDRMKRMLVPGYRPELRLNWLNLLLSIGCAFVFLLLCSRGTEAAVFLASKVLSPKERIDKLEKLDANYGSRPVQAPSFSEITIRGMVLDADGSPMAGTHWGGWLEKTSIHSTLHDFVVKDGHFEMQGGAAIHTFSLQLPGRAPFISEPYELGFTSETNLFWKLSPGFEGKIQLLTPDGAPISKAHIAMTHRVGFQANSKNNSWNNLTLPAVLSDQAGIALVNNAASLPIDLKITAAGYVEKKMDQERLKPGKPLVITLEKAKPVEGIVLSKVTGKPLPAEFRTLTGEPKNARVVAKAQADGKFRLDTLASGESHSFWVLAPGHEVVRLTGILAGQQNVLVEMGPELFIKGRLTGDLSEIQRSSVDFTVESTKQHRHGESHPVQIVDGVAYFHASNLWKGPYTISIGDQSKEIFLDKPMEDFHWEVQSKKNQNQTKRDVQFKFSSDPSAPINGEAEIWFYTEGSKYSYTTNLAVVDGMATIPLEVPARVKVENESKLKGFWVAGQDEHQVPRGDNPYVISIPVVAAGGIAGEIDGLADNFQKVTVTVMELKPSPLIGQKMYFSVEADLRPEESRLFFNSPSLPLQGVYQVVAMAGPRVATSAPIILNETTPIQKLRLKIPPGETVRGILVDGAGKPLPNRPLTVQAVFAQKNSYVVGKVVTGEDGRFVLEGLNPASDGLYKILSYHQKGYAPAAVPIQFGKLNRVILEKGQEIKGIVVDEATGHPIEGANVYAYGEKDIQNADGKTNEKGEFVFSSLLNETYFLGLRDGSLYRNQDLKVERGSKSPLMLRAKLADGSQARVVKTSDVSP